ncbi:MAG: type II toxin-antitoxin system PemK/MazF family toxin [Planctomycetes bacterium]|nr:type II toxin-antitoxin system PemK/MazF family toxin [Planctomycetota bacterium]
MMRGEVYVAIFAPRSGSEQHGRRPCIVVSRDAFTSHPAWGSVTVVPLTTSPRWLLPSPTSVQFSAGECGLAKASAALAHQITTLDRSKLGGAPIGRLSLEKDLALAKALRVYLDI